ncbi:dihydrofolate reductase [Epidermidibacterium keratini]|uniref:Dihydrofolate reductase n=1 Tax=Epidermidibacterium keratini TaxID=1891644 RepID=A0A7L4YKS5_9ACTN|nr:dihydrofolate reductase family protein [Epidermidibacterium keratini]QHB99864.1 dihydrofolate reductase [Epidermidibacterium keratini]
MRKLIYYVASTVDGFIAGPHGEVDFYGQSPELLAEIFAEYPETCPTHVRDALGVSGPARHFDTVVMGRRTQQPALDAGLTTAYPHLDNYVLTRHTDLPSDPVVTYVPTDPVALVRELKSQDGMDIWLCGGGQAAGMLAEEIDELHLKVSPVLIGGGTPLAATADLQRFQLASSRTLPGGVLLNLYRR